MVHLGIMEVRASRLLVDVVLLMVCWVVAYDLLESLTCFLDSLLYLVSVRGASWFTLLIRPIYFVSMCFFV